MNILKKSFTLSLLLLSSQSFSQINQINKIKNVLNYLNPNKKQLVVFDIDNTLLNPKTDLGSDQWFSYHVKHNMSQGLSVIDAVDKILPLYLHINQHIDLVPTENDLVEEVKLIEKDCEHVICLTARSLEIEEKTLEQLKNNKLLFEVPEIQECKLNLPDKSVYKDGVLFCGHNCKGIVLSTFLDAIHYTPDEIIFVDDKTKNLHAVEGTIEKRGIEFTGLQYTGCDHKIKKFNIEQAELELKSFLEEYPMS